MSEEQEIDLYIIRDNTVPTARYVALFMANGGVTHTGNGRTAIHFADYDLAEKQAAELSRMRNRPRAYSAIVAAIGLR